MPQVAPFGSWKSTLDAGTVAGGGVPLGELRVVGQSVLWLEGRPLEGGRQVLCRATPGREPVDVTPPGFNVRTRVHEYGGGAYAVRGETVFFANDDDQRLYRQDPGAAPRPITPEPETPAADRYADALVTPDGSRLVCVRERHAGGEVVNELVALPTDGSAPPVVLAGGRDFYSSPALSPDGRQLCWLEWDHPRMPWDGTELEVAALAEGSALGEARTVAGGPEESIFQPEWGPDGALHFVSDRSGWWNLYRIEDGTARAVAPMEQEAGVAQWTFGLSTYGFLPGGRVALLHGLGPVWSLGTLTPGGRVVDVELPLTSFVPSQLRVLGDRVVCVAGSPTEPAAVVVIDPGSGAVDVLRRSREDEPDAGCLSLPRAIEFPTDAGATAHAQYYPPANAAFEGPAGELPPLLVFSHGGPTGGVVGQLNLVIQFFTSRGFAVVDVDYRGSVGYGRAYRKALAGNWGVADVLDCINAARHLSDEGQVDGARLAIRGGSAGGYTTLCALVFHDEFAAGASHFGVGDVAALARDTHKFESRYLDGLIGALPEAAELYRERSPVWHADRLSCPVILLQGLEDAVVPPAQAEAMVTALDAKGIPHAYVAFPGEQHGFRRAENIQRAIEAELYFYSRVFGFALADPVEPVAIAHL